MGGGQTSRRQGMHRDVQAHTLLVQIGLQKEIVLRRRDVQTRLRASWISQTSTVGQSPLHRSLGGGVRHAQGLAGRQHAGCTVRHVEARAFVAVQRRGGALGGLGVLQGGADDLRLALARGHDDNGGVGVGSDGLQTNGDRCLSARDFDATEITSSLGSGRVVEVHQSGGAVQRIALLIESNVTVGPDAPKEKPDASQTGHPSLISIAVRSHLDQHRLEGFLHLVRGFSLQQGQIHHGV
mmetsp:Transcript_39009/g.67518  ORF Transcript_39009/g.67518 Transcript_39009/m.67518 type:complete len:239 (-) Transcript_39009:1607-2323(-)